MITTPEKGRSVFSTKTFEKNQYLFEYKGELLKRKKALERYNDPLYEEGKSFIYFFTYNSTRFAIDASCDLKYGNSLGRLVNHPSKYSKATAKVEIYPFQQKPKLILRALDKIEANQEITYNYNDLSPESLLNYPFLRYGKK